MSIAELAHLVARVVGYKGRLVFDPSYPDGNPPEAPGCQPLDPHGLAGANVAGDRTQRNLRLVLASLKSDRFLIPAEYPLTRSAAG